MENFSSLIQRNTEHEIASPVFSIENLNLRALAVFNHLQRDFINIRIEEVTEEFLKTHRHSSISIAIGTTNSTSIFHRIEVKKQFKHKIIIMDQGAPAVDLISQDFYNTDSGFSIPTSAVHGDRYARGDVVLIRIAIYI